MKKIFFNYSDEAEDAKMMRNLCLHFSVLKDKIDLWHKGKIRPGDTVNETMSGNLNDADAVLHLLSISYAAEDDCMQMLDQGIQQHKRNIPVLLSSFDWQSVDAINQLQEELLPHDHKPVDVHPNYNEVYTEIVQTVKKDVLGIEGKAGINGRVYYYILSGLILVVGSLVTVWANNIFHHLGITLGVFALFIIAAFLHSGILFSQPIFQHLNYNCMKYEQEDLLEKFIQNEKKSRFWALLSAVGFIVVSTGVVYVAKEVKGSPKDAIHKTDTLILTKDDPKVNERLKQLGDSLVYTKELVTEFRNAKDSLKKLHDNSVTDNGGLKRDKAKLNDIIKRLRADSLKCEERYKDNHEELVISQTKLNECEDKLKKLTQPDPNKQFNIFIKYYNKVPVTAVDKLQNLLREKFPTASIFRMKMGAVIGSRVWFYNKGDSKTADFILSLINNKKYTSSLNETPSKQTGNFEIWLTDLN